MSNLLRSLFCIKFPEYTFLKIWQLIHFETCQAQDSLISTFVHYLLRLYIYIQVLKHDDLFPSVMVCLPASPPFHVHIVSATLLACHPLPSSTPPNNTFFLSPCEPSLPFYQPPFIQASSSLLCQCCFLENQKYSAVLCMLINKAVGFFPRDLKVSPPPDWGLEFQLHSWTWVSQLPISLGKGKKKR